MRALFKEVSYPLSKLLHEIDDGEVGLPELQRPFVWSRTKVRDLFDSMYRGFPVGYLLFWENTVDPDSRHIGTDSKQHVARRLIVDGQQRLTSLYAVMRGRTIIDSDYQETELRIAFRPRDARFAVTDAATEQDPEFLPSISKLWAMPFHRFQKAFLQRLRESREVSDEEEEQIADAINRLHDLEDYPFIALELAAAVPEDQVADIFVRINSEGVELKQADFILTLMSVHWDKGRRQLEDFSRAAKRPATTGDSPFNHFIRPSPDQMLRVTVGLGLRRGVLKAVYPVLRGKDINTGAFSPEARTAQFDRLRTAQDDVLDLTNWHEFHKALQQAGYRSGDMISSQYNILFSYIAFLVGRNDHGMDYMRLRSVVARWFFMCALTGRYTGSSETRLEADLRLLGEASNADEFEVTINHIISTQLTNDFWEVALPDLLSSSAGWSPVLFAYWASLNLLGARVLFSRLTVSELLDPNLRAKKTALDRHHLFPRKYLESLGVTSTTRTNQIANYAFLEWPDNIKIGANAPTDYFPQLWSERIPVDEAAGAQFHHALPQGWEHMPYDTFLDKRRALIAQVMRAAFEKLSTGRAHVPVTEPTRLPEMTVAELLADGEHGQLEFKSTAAVSVADPNVPEKVINDQVVKTVAAFLNSDGGTLLIGIDDDRNVLGVNVDLQHKRMNFDNYVNWLTTLLITTCGAGPVTACSVVRPELVDGKPVVVVDVRSSPKPVFVKTSKADEAFYVRANNTTRQLPISQIPDYVTAHWLR